VPSSEEKVAAIIAVFKNQSAKISSRTSSKGAFTSVSVSLVIKNPEAVIANYRAVATIEGVISL
jgi:putative lipoic acid-binding regulatory protein